MTLPIGTRVRHTDTKFRTFGMGRLGTVVPNDTLADSTLNRVEWDLPNRPSQKFTNHWDAMLVVVEAAHKFPVGTRVRHRDINSADGRPFGNGTVISHDQDGSVLNRVDWDHRGLSYHEDISLEELPSEQIEATDPRLDEFFAQAKAEATKLGFCAEYDTLVARLRPTRVKTRVTVPVIVYLDVEVEHASNQSAPHVADVYRGLNDAEAQIHKAVEKGRYDGPSAVTAL